LAQQAGAEPEGGRMGQCVVSCAGQPLFMGQLIPQQHTGSPPVAVVQLSSGSSRIAAKYATLHLRLRQPTVGSV
jgi:hypothetical protein